MLGIYSIALISMMLIWQLVNRKVRVPGFSGFFAIILIGYLGLSLTYSVDKAWGVGDLFRLITPMVLLWFTYNLLESREQIIRLFKWIVAGSVIPIAYGFYQALTHTGYMDDAAGIIRINSLFYLPTVYAHYIVILLFFLIYLFLFSGKKRVKKYIFIFLLALLSLILTWGRTSIIAFLVGVILLIFLNKKRMIGIPLIVGVLIIMFLAIPQIRSRFTDPFQDNSLHTNSWQSRLILWEQASLQIIKKPILGYGIGSAPKVVQKAIGSKKVRLPHNDYLRILIDLGIIGLCLFFLLITSLFYKMFGFLIKNQNSPITGLHQVNLAILLSLCVAGLAENVMMDITSTSYAFISIASSLKLGDLSTGD